MEKNVVISDNVLVLMYKEGDINAFGTIFERYNANVRSYIYSIVKNNASSDDLMQDVFLKALTTISDMYKDQGLLKGWLLRIAHNLSINYLMKNSQYSNLTISSSGEFEKIENKLCFPIDHNSQNPEEIMISLETRYDICDLIDSLPPDQKELVVLKFFHELKYREIDEYMGLSNNSTNRVRMRAALKILRKNIKEI